MWFCYLWQELFIMRWWSAIDPFYAHVMCYWCSLRHDNANSTCAQRHNSRCKSLPHDQHINDGPSQLFHISERIHVPGRAIAIVLFPPALLGDSQNRNGTENRPILNAWNSWTSTSPQHYFFFGYAISCILCRLKYWWCSNPTIFTGRTLAGNAHIRLLSLLGCKIHFFWGTK